MAPESSRRRARLSRQHQQFVGTSTDIEDLKAAQEELHNTRAALAHMTRVMTMGELTRLDRA